MKFLLTVAVLISTEAFVVPKTGIKRPAFALKAADDAYGSLMLKLEAEMGSVGAAVTQVPPPPPPPPPAPVAIEQAVAPVVEQTSQISIPEVPVPDAPVLDVPAQVQDIVPSIDVPSIDLDLGSLGDLLPIGIGVVVLLAVAAALAGGGSDDGAASSPSPASSAGNAVDLSIPYDAAVRLAYEKAGKPGDYASFKSKYEEETVAMIKAKQSISIPYDAAAALAYQKAGMPGNYDDFKKKYLENAVAEVKAKQK